MVPAIAVSARKEFGKVFSLGTVYSIKKNTYNNLGMNLGLRLGGIQFYALTDNILAVFDPLNARSVNARLGLNLAFGKEK